MMSMGLPSTNTEKYNAMIFIVCVNPEPIFVVFWSKNCGLLSFPFLFMVLGARGLSGPIRSGGPNAPKRMKKNEHDKKHSFYNRKRRKCFGQTKATETQFEMYLRNKTLAFIWKPQKTKGTSQQTQNRNHNHKHGAGCVSGAGSSSLLT